MEIQLEIYKPPKGGWGIHVSKIGGETLKALKALHKDGRIFIHNLGIDEPDSINTVSKRLKHYWDRDKARDFVTRFHCLSLQDQVQSIAELYLRRIERPDRCIRVQYFQLKTGNKMRYTSPFYRELENLGRMYSDFKLVPSIVKTWFLSESEYDKIKDSVVEIAATPKGGHKGELTSIPSRKAVFTNKRSGVHADLKRFK